MIETEPHTFEGIFNKYLELFREKIKPEYREKLFAKNKEDRIELKTVHTIGGGEPEPLTEKIIGEMLRECEIKPLDITYLIESILIEIWRPSIEIDVLKIEILLLLLNKAKIFSNKDKLVNIYMDMESFYRPWNFLLVLQSYLFYIGKKLVSNCRHDYMINKKFDNDLTMIPTKYFKDIYNYFTRIKISLLT